MRTMRCTLSAAAGCRPLALAAYKSPLVRNPLTATNISRLGMALVGFVRELRCARLVACASVCPFPYGDAGGPK